MKNLVILSLFIIIGYLASGQQIPNHEFNTWVDHGSYEEPEFWNTSNEALAILGETTVFKSNDAYSGSYSALLETRFLLGFTNVPGLMTLADISIDIIAQTYSISGGFALQENVKMLTGMYKYTGVDNDSATVFIYNFKRDNSGDIDTIGYGTTYLHDANEWTPFTVLMDNQNTHVPDTFNVIITSSGPEFHAGSVLKVDSLAIETNTGIIHLDTENQIIVTYPNPATSVVYFEMETVSKTRKLMIFNTVGKLVNELDFNNNILKYQTTDLKSGSYYFMVLDNGHNSGSGSFIVK